MRSDELDWPAEELACRVTGLQCLAYYLHFGVLPQAVVCCPFVPRALHLCDVYLYLASHAMLQQQQTCAKSSTDAALSLAIG